MGLDGSGNWIPVLPDNPPLEDFSPANGAAAGEAAHVSGSGSPVGVLTPEFVDQQYIDLDNDPVPIIWQATGLTNNDWQQIT